MPPSRFVVSSMCAFSEIPVGGATFSRTVRSVEMRDVRFLDAKYAAPPSAPNASRRIADRLTDYFFSFFEICAVGVDFPSAVMTSMMRTI